MVKNMSFIKNGTVMNVNVPYLEAYIPAYYFPKCAKEFGRDFQVYGLFPYMTFTDTDKSGPSKLEIFGLPTVFFTTPTSYEVREIQFQRGAKDKYYVLQYNRGDTMVKNTEVIQTMKNVEILLDLLTYGNIIDTLPYGDVVKLVVKAMRINGTSLRTPLVTIEGVISEIYRYRKDPSYPLRFYIGKEFTNDMQYNYQASNLREVCGANSSFSAVTFEDVDTALTLAISKSRYGRRQADSPVEELLKM